MLASGAILFGFLTFVKKGGLKEDESIGVHAYFRDASGLGRRSRVQIAGIPVGEIVQIDLEGGRAHVQMRMRKDLSLRIDASLTKRSESLLGDYMLDLSPGSESQPLLTEGGEIKRVIDAQGMEQVFNSLNTIAQDIQAVTSSLKNVLGGSQGKESLEAIVQNLVKLTDAVDSTVRNSAGRLDEILGNVEAVSQDIRQLTSGEQASVARIVENIEVLSKDVRDIASTVKRIIGQNEEEVAGGVTSLKDTLSKLDRTLANIEAVTNEIREGKGAIGALVADERLGQKVSETVEDVADFAGRLTGLELEVGVKADYLTQQNASKTFLQLRLTPKPDKYYLLEAVDDPRGSVETIYVQQNPPVAGAPAVQKQTVTRESLKFSAQFAKRYSFLTLRFGIIESTGGLGADFSLPLKFFYASRWLEDALVLKVDAFNFSIESLRFPRLRASIRFSPFDHIYLNAGFDDILNNPNRDLLTNRMISGRDFFVGAGIYFTDADLKSLLPLVPTP